MSWYTYLAIKHLFPSKKTGSFFSIISIVGVILGVMVLVIVQSIMNGFQDDIKTRIVQNQGDIRIDSDNIIYNYEDISEELTKYKEIKNFAPYGMGIAMMQLNDRQAFPYVKGIDAQLEKNVLPIEKFTKTCNIEDLDSESIIVSYELAKSIGAHIGDQVDVYSPIMLQKIKNDEIILPKTLEVIGLLETGSYDIDRNTILVSLDLIQDLYGLGYGIHGITIKLVDNVDVDKFVKVLRSNFAKTLHITNWKEINQNLLFVLQTEKSMMFFVLLFVLLVASFSIACSLMTSVVRKTKEIGLLQALGAKTRQIMLCFCMQGLIIGIIGSILGLVFGTIALSCRNNIIHAITKIFHIDNALMNFYHFSDLPVKYSGTDFFIIITFSIIICGLAGLIPAWKVSKIKPSEALRNE